MHVESQLWTAPLYNQTTKNACKWIDMSMFQQNYICKSKHPASSLRLTTYQINSLYHLLRLSQLPSLRPLNHSCLHPEHYIKAQMLVTNVTNIITIN